MNRIVRIVVASVALALPVLKISCQGTETEAAMRTHYEAAYRLQSAGKVDPANREFVAFLVIAVNRLANGYANIGDYDKAKLMYKEALRLMPGDSDVLHDYASAALTAKDNEAAEQALSSALTDTSRIPAARIAELHVLRGKLQMATQGRKADLADFRSAVELDASCDNIYALANAELAVAGVAAAEKDYTRYRARCGNTPAIRINIGRAYAINGVPDHALSEFRAAAALDPSFPDVHYCIGAAYLQSSKENFDLAEAELRKELALHPDDRFSYAQLGHIALMRHRNEEAEHDYRRAVALNPQEPANFIELGQLLAESGRGAEGAPFLRKAIELTPDASHARYDIERAHFQLGRILLQQGHKEDAQRELAVAADLLNRSRHQAEVDLNGEDDSASNALSITRIPSPKEKAQVASYVRSIGPLLASVYNNLGVNLANAGLFSEDASDFAAAAQWNPALAGVDANLGRASYLAGQYSDAISPLERAVRARPSDSELSGMLESARQRVSTPPQP